MAFTIIDRGQTASKETLDEYAAAMCKVQHPNLLPVLDIQSRDDGHWRLIFPGLTSTSLSLGEARLDLKSPLQVFSVLLTVAEVCRELRQVGVRGYAHLDWSGWVYLFKTSNNEHGLLIEPPTPGDVERIPLSRQSDLDCIPPEWSGAAQAADEASDSYGLAVLLTHLIPAAAPLRPTRGRTVKPLVPLSEIPPPIQELTRRALEANPAVRPTLSDWCTTFLLAGATLLPGNVRLCFTGEIPTDRGFKSLLKGHGKTVAAIRTPRGVLRDGASVPVAPCALTPSSPVISQFLETVVVPTSSIPGADPVDCAVFAPQSCVPGDMFLVQTYFHLPESAADARQFATEADPEALRLGFKPLTMDIPRGTMLHAELTIPQLEVDDAVQRLRWEGRTEALQFCVSVPDSQPCGTRLGKLRVFLEGMPVGQVAFKICIARATRMRNDQAPVACQESAKHYRQAFISYASQDRTEVLKRVQIMDRFHIRFFQDVLSIEPGQRWEQELYRRIDESDLFLLFWSNAAKSSKWVLAEVEYAVKKRAAGCEEPEIVPVIIEGPPAPTPPASLQHLHFNDRLIYFMQQQ